MGKFPWSKPDPLKIGSPDFPVRVDEEVAAQRREVESRALEQRMAEAIRRQQMEEMYRQMQGIYSSGGTSTGRLGSAGTTAQKAPDPLWVLVEVTLIDGTIEAINYDAATVSVQRLIEESAKTDMLCVRNAQEWLIVPTEQIKTIKIKKMSMGE